MGRSLVRVAVISESAIVRDGLGCLIGGLGNRAIVVDCDFSRGRPAHVDVVVYDLGATSGLNGYAELRHLVGLEIPIVALDYDGVASAGWRASGHTELISLGVTATELLEVLERVAPGPAAGRHHSNAPRPPAGLTNRELTVIALIGSGLSNKQIAARLHVEVPTVKHHVHHILHKLGVASRTEAVARLRGRARLAAAHPWD